VGRPEYSKDSGLTRGTPPEKFTELVKNTYRVLLSRGLRGCYVHFLDEQTRDFVMSRIDEFGLGMAAEEQGRYGPT
jgi:hypothetical protein